MTTEQRRPADPDPAAVDTFWRDFCEATGVTGRPVDVFCFGDSVAMADELLALVLAGTKRATAGLLADYDEEGFRPAPGDHSVVHAGDGTPAAVIRTRAVHTGTLSSVDAAFAWEEGEGERTLDSWLDGHRAYFRRAFADAGRPPDDDPELLYERFDLVWPA